MGVTLCPLMNTSQKRGDRSSWKRSKETGQRSVLLLSTGQPEAILQGWTSLSWAPPPVCLCGEDCAVQKMCAWGGDKEP